MNRLFFGDEEPNRVAFAALCTRGHLLTWDTQKRTMTPACGKCGATILTACPNCSKPFPGEADFRDDIPYRFDYCVHCASAYPWTASKIEYAKRTIIEEAEVESWNAAVKERALELIDDIATQRATGPGLVTAFKWLGQRGGESAKIILVEVVKTIGTESVKGYLVTNGFLAAS